MLSSRSACELTLMSALLVSAAQSEAVIKYLDYSDLAILDTFNGSYLAKNSYRGLYTKHTFFPGDTESVVLFL